MRFCIHRGTQEISGTCVEIESQGKRIVLDAGLPLDDAAAATMDLHPAPGFDNVNPTLRAAVLIGINGGYTQMEAAELTGVDRNYIRSISDDRLQAVVDHVRDRLYPPKPKKKTKKKPTRRSGGK